jgi:hypothetical protein
MVPQ